MKTIKIFFTSSILLPLVIGLSICKGSDTIVPRIKVTLPEAHIGNLEIDTNLLDSYELLPDNIRNFYIEARAHFSSNPDAGFTDAEIIKAAQKNNLVLMGGPMLGRLRENGVTIWLRPAVADILTVTIENTKGANIKTVQTKNVKPGKVQRIEIKQLTANSSYNYSIILNDKKVAGGSFKTTPASKQEDTFRIAFGSCFHKIGLHNPNLIDQIIQRKADAMLLLGDLAVDDRENQINMHRADYLLRDVSAPWCRLVSNTPIYSAWDDHDYFNNDLSGIPEGFTVEDRDAVRTVWKENWNNPEYRGEGINFNSKIGPVEIIMLDTRSCRVIEKRRTYGAYIGEDQLAWLKETLKKSKALFKIITSGTMWSDYISNGKDSWGTWDTEMREEIFRFIESENIQGVLLASGDRHGARAFAIPEPSGFTFYEFEAATLGGVPGPAAMAKDTSNQLFGYHGKDFIAFGEFTFQNGKENPSLTFRLIHESGKILEEHKFKYKSLTPNP